MNRQIICDMGYEESIVFDNPNFDRAIVGITEEGRVVYDYDKMIAILVKRDGMTEWDAADFISYNTIRTIPYAGEYAPIIMHKLEA